MSYIFAQHVTTCAPTQGTPHMDEQMLRNFNGMLYKRIQPSMQWAELKFLKLAKYFITQQQNEVFSKLPGNVTRLIMSVTLKLAAR